MSARGVEKVFGGFQTPGEPPSVVCFQWNVENLQDVCVTNDRQSAELMASHLEPQNLKP